MPKCIFNFELNRRVPNGMHGGVRGGRESLLLDFEKIGLILKYRKKRINDRNCRFILLERYVNMQ